MFTLVYQQHAELHKILTICYHCKDILRYFWRSRLSWRKCKSHGKNTVVLLSSRLFIDFNQQEQAIYSAHFHPSYFY